MKRFKVECEHVMFPFGDGAPVCVKEYVKTARFDDLRPCDHKHCDIYKSIQKKKENQS